MNEQKPVQKQINVNAEDLKTIQCPCGQQFFDVILVLKVLPALISNTGKAQIVQMPCFRCVDCHTVISAKMIEEFINSSEVNNENNIIVSQ